MLVSVALGILVTLVACAAASSPERVAPYGPIHAGANCENLLESIYEEVLVARRYNKNIRPASPTNVTVNFYINDYIMDPVNSQFTANIFFRNVWYDNRLAYDNLVALCPSFTDHILLHDEKSINEVWYPHFYFTHQLSSFNHDTPDGLLNQYMRIYKDGQVVTSKYLSVTSACKRLPGDEFFCQIEPGTYGSLVNQVILQWRQTNPVAVDEERMSWNDYVIYDVETVYIEDIWSSGTYPLLISNFKLRPNTVSH